MMDFLRVYSKPTKKGVEVYPVFVVKSSKDLMVRGRDFYAMWDEESGLWTKDESDVMAYVDSKVQEEADNQKNKTEDPVYALYMWNSDSGVIDKWHRYVQKQMRDHYHTLDEKIIFSNQKTKKTDYASKKLSYAIGNGSLDAYEELMSTLYDPDERTKLEWAIGSIISGDSKRIQKFIVLYGSAGSGKSTVLNIIQKLFEGYVSIFDSRELASSNNAFALESFNSNPLVSIQHDGDLSRIEDNTKLNSIVSHETMTVNEKFKSKYTAKFNTFLFMGTNKPVKITEAKSGLLRRLIDVRPSGRKLPYNKYVKLMKSIEFELGAIAQHCLDRYLELGENYYENYIPVEMMSATNDTYSFIEYSYLDFFTKYDELTLRDIWEEYKSYVDYAKVQYPMTMRALGVEMRNYYDDYKPEGRLDGRHVRNIYSGFKRSKFEQKETDTEKSTKEESWLIFKSQKSLFDETHQNCPAQLANENGTPTRRWANVTTTLKDIDTSKTHYVKIEEHEVAMDFDKKDENGNKSFELNYAEAVKWPPTYAELSKSGEGIHLHYLYSGDVSELKRVISEDVELKVFTGDSSLRRRLTKCNDIPIATISSGLPLREKKKMLDDNVLKNEAAIANRIKKCLRKEHHGATTPEISFIKKTLDDAYEAGVKYDVRVLRPAVLAFANNSTHQSSKCVSMVAEMKFCSDDYEENFEEDRRDIRVVDESKLVFYDVEVFPNLFLLNWKFRGKEQKVNRMINPDAKQLRLITKYNLVGFNNRRYDNHIVYARLHGYSNEELYALSQKIISGSKNAMFASAYNLSYTDVYDFCSKKQSLKKWEIELGIVHKELGLRWDEPVPEHLWGKVAEYCDNDVIATEAVFEANQGDWIARKILADLADMSVNSSTNSLTTRIIFGTNKKPNLVYTDFKTGKQYDRTGKDVTDPSIINKFDGYDNVYSDKDKKYHNMYRNVDIGYGGYVFSKPGIWYNVDTFDVSSMHPTSAVQLQAFGEDTKKFKELKDARIYIKHGDYDSASKMFDGRLSKYLTDKKNAKALAGALKIAINSVYGLSSAKFDNPFRDDRNKNNIVALRGALFMKTLQDEVESRGFTVVHIKTDSIKVPNATPEIREFIMSFGQKYGYSFEHESTYQKMCLVNDAVFIAKYSNDELNGDHKGKWTATGAQFQVPFVFKSLFSKEKLEFSDFCETKSVSTALYLDMNEDLPDVSAAEKAKEKLMKSQTPDQKQIDILNEEITKGHNYQFVGKVGLFCPIKPGYGGGELLREVSPGKYSSANDAKGYRWLESEIVKTIGNDDWINKEYYDRMAETAIDAISQYGDFYSFVSDDIIDIRDGSRTY